MQASGLFIWAATAYQFICRGGPFADDRLHDVLNGVSDAATPEKSLDSIYLTVLGKVVDNCYRQNEQEELYAALYAVLATVTVSAIPVNRHSLSLLVQVRHDSVNKALPGLHSILVIPEDIRRPIRLHHASFRDFITDPRRCDNMRFSVNQLQQHKILAERCLGLLDEHLWKDTLDLRSPSVGLSTIDRSEVDQTSFSYGSVCLLFYCQWVCNVSQPLGGHTTSGSRYL